MQRYAIVKDGVVLNAVEYEEQPVGTPPGFEEGAVAIQDGWAAPGWLYADGVFTDPNPPAVFVMPTEEQLA
jgi:hypothetical protein